MISLKEAAQAAESFVREVYAANELWSLRIEEAELSNDEKTWLITLGWVEQAIREPSVFFPTLKSEPIVLPRVYKQFIIDADTGKVRSMKIRQA